MIEKPESLLAYKLTRKQPVVWGDMDSMRHVNNTKYFYYCETARIEFLRILFPDLGHIDPSKITSGLALAETSCRFKVPVTYPDELLIGTAVTDINDSHFFIKHALYSSKMELIAAEAFATMVHYDFVNNKRLPLRQKQLEILISYQLKEV